MNAVPGGGMPMAPMAGGPVGGTPMPMMNNGIVPPQQGPQQVPAIETNRALLNTYIYEYFLRNDMFDCARSILNSNQPINVSKDGKSGNPNGLGDDPMDTDSKDDVHSKRPEDLPAPNVPVPTLPDSCFLQEWFALFWDMFNAQRGKSNSNVVQQYVTHTQNQSRIKQTHQQEMLRNIRPDQLAMMKNIGHASMIKHNLARTAIANNQNPGMMMMAKQNQMQRDPSNMDGNQQRPGSPGSTENAPSPSKRPRLEGPSGQFQMQPSMMRNGGPPAPGQPVGTGPGSDLSQTRSMLLSNGINPNQLTHQQLNSFANQAPNVQAKSIATYAQNLQQHHGAQMPNKQMPNPNAPQGQGSPMIPQGPTEINAYYNGAMGPEGMRPGGPATQGGGSNHALQDYQMQLMLLEQQNKRRLMMARQEQSDISTISRPDGPPGPGGPAGPNGPPGVTQGGPNGQGFQESPQGPRAGASPNPADMKRGTPQMNNASIPSPLPENAQNRGSPSAMNFMGNVDPSQGPHFYGTMESNRVANAQINGAMRPPSSHPGMPNFNGQQMASQQQQMIAQRQAQGQAQGQSGAQVGPNGMQWPQGGPTGNQVMPQGAQGPQGAPQVGPQGPQPIQSTPQRAMLPPSAPSAGGNAPNARNTTASPQQNNQPPTPQQSNKAAPKKKDSKSTKDKRVATSKKSTSNLNASTTPAADNTQDAEPPTPATPITPANTGFSGKGNQSNPAPQPIPNGAPASAPVAQAPPPQDPAQNGFSLDGTGMDINFEFGNAMNTSDVLQDFDFDSFLHDNENGDPNFDFGAPSFAMDGNEISAEQ